MFAATLLAALAAPAGVPTPHDLAVAEAALHALDGDDVPPRTARATAAVLAAMVRLGACDPGGEGQWFSASLDWRSEWGYARRLVAEVAACPPLSEDTLPPGAWYRQQAAALQWEAGDHYRRANEFRARIPWEPEIEAGLTAWAVYHDGLATACAAEAGRYEMLAGGHWQRPRRVVLKMAAGK